MIKTFGFKDYQIMLSTRPEHAAGSEEIWNEATDTLRHALVRAGVEYKIDPGEGVFYGPKIDIKFVGILGKAWQGPTIQVDFNLPQRFKVNYIGEDGKEHQVAMVHRTVLGSMERFLATVLENYAGALPVWLAPVQAKIIPVADRHLDYARKLAAELKAEKVRVEVDDRSERINLKVRQAQLEKVPYMLVVGDKEVAGSTVAIRLRSGKQLEAQPFETFKGELLTVIVNKVNDTT
jgi:threonyl-tRNA synthetase